MNDCDSNSYDSDVTSCDAIRRWGLRKILIGHESGISRITIRRDNRTASLSL